MDTLGPGRALFAAAMMGFGVMSIITTDFDLDWQPVPAGLPFRAALACCSGALLLAAGAGLFTRRWAGISAGILAGFLLLWLLVLHGIQVTAAPRVEGVWEISGETALHTAAAWMLFASLAQGSHRLAFVTGKDGARLACLLFGLGLIPIGLSHFVYAQQSVGYVPAWLPDRPDWVYVTGAAHAAAGLALIFGVLPRLAATLEAAMLGIITLLVNVPHVVAAPAHHAEWTWLCADLASTAGAWLAAGCHRDTAWLSLRSRLR